MVGIIGDNEPEWFWGEFAVQAAGGIPTGIFVDCIPSEVKYIASHSDTRFAIVNDQEQTDKFLEIKDELPLLKKIIYWDPKGLRNYDDPLLISFDEVIKLGQEYEKTHPDVFERNVDRGKAADTAFIYYTSGTTGLPEGRAYYSPGLDHDRQRLRNALSSHWQRQPDFEFPGGLGRRQLFRYHSPPADRSSLEFSGRAGDHRRRHPGGRTEFRDLRPAPVGKPGQRYPRQDHRYQPLKETYI